MEKVHNIHAEGESSEYASPSDPLIPAQDGEKSIAKDTSVSLSLVCCTWLVRKVMAVVSSLLIVSLAVLLWPNLTSSAGCNTDQIGYECNTPISHHWGQYSAYFSVQSKIPDTLPTGCKITFAQILSRHGARYPTASKGASYAALIKQIQTNVKSFPRRYAFLEDYTYDLGADDLTAFGEDQLFRSGRKFYERYESLTKDRVPFIRASGEDRVVDSAQQFARGYQEVKAKDPKAATPDGYPYEILVIPESPDYNNTLDHSICTSFEDGKYDNVPDTADSQWTSVFVPEIQMRLNNDLVGANLTTSQVIYMMDLCPFNTLIPKRATTLSPFCGLFSNHEWQQYNYYQSVDKYYSYGQGNPLGPTQGVGYTNELIARLTNKPVQDETSTNHTLDDDPKTFPIGKSHKLFADFSHDTQMNSIFFAMNLYNATQDLPTTHYVSAPEAGGYSAAHVSPFAARAYFEKMQCAGQDEELVRVLVNDRVIPLAGCGADKYGRCTVSSWVDTLTFAKNNGRWNECFT